MALDETAIDQITQAFTNHGAAIQGALLNGATDLFGGLAVIELVWVVGWSVAHKTDIFDIMIVVTRLAIGLGFWLWMIRNWVQMASAITRTFWTWGNAATGAAGGSQNVSPLNYFNAGLDLISSIWGAMGLTTPATNFVLAIGGVVVCGVFAWIAALMVMVIAEAFIASYIGSVLLAFNALSVTRDFGTSPIRYAVAVGVKLMTMQFIAGISQGIVQGWATSIATGTAPSWKSLGIMMGVPLILALMAWRAPNVAQDVIMGSHLSAGNPLVSAIRQVASAVATIATSAAGGVAATAAAAQLAGRQMAARTAEGTAPTSAAARAATVARLTAQNAASGVASDVGKRLSGSYSAAHGYRGFRVAADLNNKQQS